MRFILRKLNTHFEICDYSIYGHGFTSFYWVYQLANMLEHLKHELKEEISFESII